MVCNNAFTIIYSSFYYSDFYSVDTAGTIGAAYTVVVYSPCFSVVKVDSTAWVIVCSGWLVTGVARV